MTDFLAVLRHEFRRVRRDRAIPWLLVIFTALSAYASYNGRLWVDERRTAQMRVATELQKARSEYLQRLGARAPGSSEVPVAKTLATAIQYRPTLPIRPLAAVSPGQADGYPHSAKFFALTKDQDIFEALAASLEHPSVLVAGRFDLAFVIVVVFPLLLLAATYDLWTEERDIGTSSLVLSQPARPAAALAAKAVARGASVLAAASLVLVISMARTAWDGSLEIAGLAQAGTSVVLYGTLWVAVAVLINVFIRNSTAAALGSLTTWLCAVVLLPALLSAVLDLLNPPPSRAVHAETLRIAALKREESEAPSASPPQSQRALGAAPRTRMQALQDSIERARVGEHEYDVLTQPFETRWAERRRVAHLARFASPAVLAQDALDRIAGTDADRALLFQAQVREFLRELRRHASSQNIDENGKNIDDHLNALPQFTFREPSRTAALAPLSMDWIALGAYSLAIGLAAGLGIRRRRLYRNESGASL